LLYVVFLLFSSSRTMSFLCLMLAAMHIVCIGQVNSVGGC